MNKVTSRPWTAADLTACLAIFDSNLPTFFAPAEREEFREYLENLTATTSRYIVLQRENSVVACGGLAIEANGKTASLTWGMVDRGLHSQGLGTFLMQARLTTARSIPGISDIELSTSQHTRLFYQRFGFFTRKITPYGFGPGLDRWDMVLTL